MTGPSRRATPPTKKYRDKLRAAIDRACIARGEAQWTNGYRAAAEYGKKLTEAERIRLYEKERAQFKYCELAEANAERAMRAYAASLRGMK